jgi:hypothetical protein
MIDDNAIELALKTWYPSDHPLHLNPHHPLGKLLGEWGELLDDYMKLLYKPNYKPHFADELGDIWYYIRILSYQQNYEPQAFRMAKEYSPDKLIAMAITMVCSSFESLQSGKIEFPYRKHTLDTSYTVLLILLERIGLTLDELTQLNWQKLQPGSARGEEWMKAR